MLPVAIVGGGPVGLASSILLSLRRIPHVVFEQYPGTSIHPKAAGLNQRTIEIFRQMGIENEVIKQRAPPQTAGRTAWYTSLGTTGREIISRDAWGGGKYAEEYKKASPSPYCVLPQIRLEPILQKRALELNTDGIKYKTEVTNIEEKSDRVRITTKHRETEAEEVIEARYCIAADGGRKATEWLGIEMQGEKNIVDMVTAHFRSPLTALHPDPSIFITWFINPEMGGSIGTGYLYHLGPYPSKPETEEWVFACGIRPDDPKQFDTESMIKRVRKSINVPNLPIELLSLSHWFVNAITAERYRSKGGRTFLVGDSAHRIPPWGALGLNSGIQDANNLIWKLGLLLKDEKYDKLLDTYGEERRPIGERVGRTSLHNLRSHNLVMDQAIGISADASAAENQKALEPYFDKTHPEHETKRKAVEEAQEILDTEFKALGGEIGWFYPSADINNEGAANRHDGQLLENGELDTQNYHPSTIPGHNIPHAWLSKDGTTVSTRDLTALDKFVLITETPGLWDNVESDLIQVEVVDGHKGWTDVGGSYREQCQVDKDGAVLIRPDGIVAWRSKSHDPKVTKDLPNILRRVLKLEADAS